MILSRNLAAAAIFAGTAAPQDVERLRPEHAEELRALQPAIDGAIDKGIAWLLSTQQRDGSWTYEDDLFQTGQTALCAYTLMKCGVPSDHAAIQRALAHIRTVRPTLVYAAACQMLALAEARSPTHHEHMQRIVRDLESWQDGSWDYPNPGGAIGRLHSDRDLSITQFALLGLRAGQRAGIKVSTRGLRDAVDAVLRYQERGDVAGFRYHFRTRGKSTGSMTTAGIGALQIAADCLEDKLGKQRQALVDEACKRAIAWLDTHWTVDANPNGNKSWLYYYLYGLERVGALLQREYIGDHPWYLEGARFLIDKQGNDGNWYERHSEPDTCFALLFLKRATAPTTGEKARKAPIVETPAESPVGVTVRGGGDGSPVQAWIHRLRGLGPDDTPARWPDVVRVSYLVDDEVTATVDLGGPWRANPCLATLPVRTRGTYRVTARVELGEPDAEGRLQPSETVSSTAIDVRVDYVLEDWMLAAATAASRNLLTDARPRASASSVHKSHAAGRAVDGHASTAWLYDKGDAEPTLRLRLTKSIRARLLWFAQAHNNRRNLGHHDRIQRISVRLDREDPIVIDLDDDPLASTAVELPQSIRFKQLEIRVLERAAGKQYPGLGGFAEIGVE